MQKKMQENSAVGNDKNGVSNFPLNCAINTTMSYSNTLSATKKLY